MTLCVKIDWVTKDGHFMRRKYIGVNGDVEANWVARKVIEELRALPQFDALLFLQIHDDFHESGERYS